MTALNGITQPGAAYLLTDGACYDAAHRIIGIWTKVLAFEEARLAIGWTGYCDLMQIADMLAQQGARTQAQIMAALPAIQRELSNGDAGSGFDLLAALWYEPANEPRLYAMHSHQLLFGPGYRPGTPVRLHNALQTSPNVLADTFGREVDVGDPASFDARSDGLRLLELQRATPFEDGAFAVGGFAEITAVTATGVSSEVLRWWPDQIGKPIQSRGLRKGKGFAACLADATRSLLRTPRTGMAI